MATMDKTEEQGQVLPEHGPYELHGISYMNEMSSNTDLRNTGDEEIWKAGGGEDHDEGLRGS